MNNDVAKATLATISDLGYTAYRIRFCAVLGNDKQATFFFGNKKAAVRQKAHRPRLVKRRYLGSHKGPAIRSAIRAAGAKLFFLPPYSLDLNPAEQVLAKLKHLMRKAAERTADAIWRRIGALLAVCRF